MSQSEQHEPDVRIEETRAEIHQAMERAHELVVEAKRNLGAAVQSLRREQRTDRG